MSSATDFFSLETETVNRTVQIICPTLGTFLAFAGFKKLLTKWDEAEAIYQNNGFSTAVYRNTAILEVIGGLGLFFPHMRFPGLVILISMIAFLEIRTKRSAPRPPLQFLIPARIMQAVLVGLAWVLRPRFGG